MRGVAVRSMVVFVSVVAAGCDPTKNTTTTVDTGDVAVYAPVCSEVADCDLTVHITGSALDALRTCYGWDGTEYTVDPPDLLETYCPNPDIGNCDIPVGTLEDLPVTVNLDCQCVPAEDLNDSCCEFDWESADNLSDALLDELDTDCGNTVGHSVSADCTSTLQDSDPCLSAASGFPIPPLADLILYLDELNSYVEITTPLDNRTFALSGGGTAKTGSPDGFLSALAWAEDAELGNYDWNNWKWWMTAPLAIDMQSGAFTIPVTTNTPPFHGAGFQDTTPKLAEVYMAEEPTGHVYPLSDTFDLDFTQTSYGWTVEVHLEGNFEPAP